jgi:PKD repeat protein
MGDGSPILTDLEVTYTFASEGQQVVSLTATNDTAGCTVTSTDTIYISVPEADFEINNAEGCQPLVVSFEDLSQDAVSYSWDFGDGLSAGGPSPTHVYEEIGSYDVTFIVTDASGCKDTLSIPNAITVTGTTANFLITDAVGCDSLAVTFEDLSDSLGTISTWLWDFGDGQNSSNSNPIHVYENPGLYDVTLTVLDTGTCENSISYTGLVEYIPYPDPSFSISLAEGCLGDSISLTNTSTGNAVEYEWDFGNGQNSTEFEPMLSYETEGYFDINLTAINERGCESNIIIDSAVAILHPVANFSAFPTFAFCPPLIVGLTDLSLGNVVEWEWDFGDQSSSTLQDPSHIYNVSGSFDVSLIVWNDFGCPDTLSENELVLLAGPSGDFNIYPEAEGCPPFDLTYVSNATGATTYTWDFGDGYLGLGDSVIHTYDQIGTYIPSLILEDDNGCVFTYQTTDTISVNPLSVDAGMDTIICQNDSIQLIATGGEVYSWFPIDGLNNPNSDTVFASPEITTTYIVSASLGQCNNTDSVTIFVNPTPQISIQTNEVCLGDTTFLTSSNSSVLPDSIIAWVWEFGDSQASTNQLPNGIIYSAADTFLVSLDMETNSGCSANGIGLAIVNPSPIADFSFNDTCLFLTTSLEDLTQVDNGTVTNWSWNLGNGSSSTLQNPSLVYLQDSIYNVTLVATASGGCTDTVTRQVEVFSLPAAEIFVENVCLNETSIFLDSSTVNSGSISEWEWDFGDSNTSTIQNPGHIYDTTGTYAVSLILTTDNGCQDATTIATTVYALPKSLFTLSAQNSCVKPANIDMINNSSGADIFFWNLGNGATETTLNTNAIYDSVGTFPIELLVTSEFGCQDSSEQLFEVYPSPIAEFSVEVTDGCPPLTIQFTNSSANANEFSWDFGNGEYSTGLEPLAVYDTAGSYTIQMAVIGEGGCTDTLTLTDLITTFQNPTALFEYNPIVTSDSIEGLVQFYNNSIDYSSLWWDFGDENTSAENNPIHQYDFHGSKFVRLGVMNENGCVDTLNQYIFIEFFGNLNAPNAMIPGDANPEVRVFLPKGTGLGYYRMMIFDEWGNKLFETTELENGSPSEPWDGTYMGKLVPQDVYIWKIDAVFDNGDRWDGKEYSGQEFHRTGTVSVLR